MASNYANQVAEPDEYDESPPNHREVNGGRVGRVAHRDYASTTTVYIVNRSDVFHADRNCHRIPDDAWPTADTLPEVMSSGALGAVKPCEHCTLDIEECAEVAVGHDGLPEYQLDYIEPGDTIVNERFSRTDDGGWERTNVSERDPYAD